MKLSLEFNTGISITEQLAGQIEAQIRANILNVGAKLPSIRQLAANQKIGLSPVVEAYELLASRGLVHPRHGSGYYVANFVDVGKSSPETLDRRRTEEDASRILQQFSHRSDVLKLSSGFIPEGWRDIEGITQTIRQISRQNVGSLIDYAMPQGDAKLRDQICIRLGMIGIDAKLDNVMITNSASHALDLVVRTMLKAGDTVFVEDPGYFNLFGLLSLQGIKLVGIPRLAGGPDVEVVEELLRHHQPKAFFVNSVFHNPTATNLSQKVAYQLLQLANRHGFFIIEDDVYADFQTTPSARLAALDQFDRVIYIGGFSKTLSSSLRLGYMAGKSELIRHFVDVKVLTSLGGTRLSELVVASLLESGLYRKHLKHLARRMNDTLSDAIEQLIRCGWQVFDDPCGGTFIWASVPGIEKSEILAEGASQFNIAMSPGNIYRPNQEPTAWIRINAAHALEERAADYMMQMAEIGTQRRQ